MRTTRRLGRFTAALLVGGAACFVGSPASAGTGGVIVDAVLGATPAGSIQVQLECVDPIAGTGVFTVTSSGNVTTTATLLNDPSDLPCTVTVLSAGGLAATISCEPQVPEQGLACGPDGNQVVATGGGIGGTAVIRLTVTFAAQAAQPAAPVVEAQPTTVG